MCTVQVDLKDVENYFFFFKMNKKHYGGRWLSPINEMVEYWQYCFEIIAYGEYVTLTSSCEEYDGTQEKIDYNCNKKSILLNFDFPDEDTALYFQLKFCS